MDPPKSGWRSKQKFYKRKASTKKIVNRITYDPQKHKQRKTKELRQKLQSRTLPSPPIPTATPSKLKFGSINVNGLDVETAWAVEELLKKRGFDVSFLYYNIMLKTILGFPGVSLERDSWQG